MRRRTACVPRGPVNQHPVFIASGSGASLMDVDGNRFLDFAGGLGCLGHTNASIVTVNADSITPPRIARVGVKFVW